MNNKEEAPANRSELERIIRSFTPPVLIVSTIVGKGIYSIGEALKECFPNNDQIYHLPIEEMLPDNALNEDYHRYAFISNHAPILLNLVYRIPIFYYRKLIREKYLKTTGTEKITAFIRSQGIKTVICTSHRPAFWLAIMKIRTKLQFKLWGMLSEFGRSLGWKYIPWEVVDGYLSPVNKETLDFPFPENMQYKYIELPCSSGYYSLAHKSGKRNKVLLVTGHWGQVFLRKAVGLLNELTAMFPGLGIHVVCGKNDKLFQALSIQFKQNPRVIIHPETSGLLELMGECGSIITKPGISTILEAHAAQRQIFLLKGMPVAEDNNARYAIEHFGARWYSMEKFKCYLNS